MNRPPSYNPKKIMLNTKNIIRTFVIDCNDEFFSAAPMTDLGAAAYMMGGEL